MYAVALGLWAAFLLAAVYYTRRHRHPAIRPLAAYLIFVTVFTIVSFVVFAAIIVVMGLLGAEAMLDTPLAGIVALLVMFVPAFAVARWQIRKPPRPPVKP